MATRGTPSARITPRYIPGQLSGNATVEIFGVNGRIVYLCSALTIALVVDGDNAPLATVLREVGHSFQGSFRDGFSEELHAMCDRNSSPLTYEVLGKTLSIRIVKCRLVIGPTSPSPVPEIPTARLPLPRMCRHVRWIHPFGFHS